MLISSCVAWTNINLPCLTRVCPTTTRYLHRNSTQETLSDIHMNINLTTFSRIFSNWICDQVFTVTHFPEWNGSNQAQTITVISFYCGVTQRRQWRACENCSLEGGWCWLCNVHLTTTKEELCLFSHLGASWPVGTRCNCIMCNTWLLHIGNDCSTFPVLMRADTWAQELASYRMSAGQLAETNNFAKCSAVPGT